MFYQSSRSLFGPLQLIIALLVIVLSAQMSSIVYADNTSRIYAEPGTEEE